MCFLFFFKNWYKAAILTTLTLILIFSYGQIYNVLESASLFGLNLGRHRILLPIYLGIFVGGVLWVAKKISNPQQINEILNIVGLVALAIPIFQIVAFQINSSQLWGQTSQTTPRDSHAENLQNPNLESLPDVYYIVLDAYARGDTMQDFYGFDNELFLSQLEEIGFYVAECSQSNYAKTRLSIASTLKYELS